MKRILMIFTALLASGVAGFGYTNVLENSASQTITNGWDAAGDMVVGGITSNNVLTISSGGSLTNLNGYVGQQATALNNTATVAGLGSRWHNSGSLNIGGAGSNSVLRVEDSGSVFVGQDLTMQNRSWLIMSSTGSVEVAGNMAIDDSTVSGEGTIRFSPGTDNVLSIHGTNTVIEPGMVFDAADGADSINVSDWTFTVSDNTTNQFRNFENLTITDGVLSGTGTLDAFDSTTVSGGRIAPTGDLVIDGNFSVSGTVTLELSAGATSLRVTDPAGLDTSSMAAEIYVDKNQNPEGFNEVILTADGGLSGGFASTNLVEYFLLYDLALATNATTVSVVSEAAQNGDFGAELAYGGIQGIRAGFNGMANAAFVRTQQLRRNTVATDQTISNKAFLLSSTNAPAGPQGPGDQNTIFGMHFWAQQFSGQGDYDTTEASAGFTLNNNGTSFGLDRLLGDSLVVGGNYTYSRSAARTTNSDRVDTETYWFGIYSEWYKPSGYYLDGLLAVGWSDYDTGRTETGYEGTGSFRGSDFGGHLEGGKYFHTRHWAMAPYAGLQYLAINSDAYTETEKTGGHEINISDQSIASLESALGIKLRNRFDTQIGRFQTIGYAEWVYDFINDDIGYSLSQGALSVETARIAPDASLLNAGIGLSWICTDYLEIGLAYDGRFNENYAEQTGSLMLDVRF